VPEPLATADDLAAYSNGAVSAADPRAENSLAGVSAAIRNYCGWHVTPSLSELLTLDGPGGRLLSLPTKYLTAVSSIVEDETVLADKSDFRWSADGSVKRLAALWSDDFRIIDATITHGYPTARAVKAVALAVVTRELSSPTGATREQAGAVSVSWALSAPGVSGGIALLAHEREILDFYRIESV